MTQGMANVANRIGGTAADEGWIARAQTGDLAAFDALIATRLDRCHRIAWSILSDAADAADAVQDACVLAWRDLPRLREPGAFDGWLNQVVVNCARTVRRRRTRRIREVVLPDDQDASAGGGLSGMPAGADPTGGIVDADAITRAFDQLPAEQRALLVLHHVERVPLADIARALGIPSGTVKSRLHTARRALEAALEVEA
jgi:RNA polymerase sigma-70 factor (ECF subfamily)